MLTSPAELARVIRNAGVNHHPIAGLDPGHTSADFDNLPRTVRSQDVRILQLRVREAVDNEQIEMIQGSRANADPHIARTWWGRVRDVGNRDLVQTTGAAEDTRLHLRTPTVTAETRAR